MSTQKKSVFALPAAILLFVYPVVSLIIRSLTTHHFNIPTDVSTFITLPGCILLGIALLVNNKILGVVGTGMITVSELYYLFTTRGWAFILCDFIIVCALALMIVIFFLPGSLSFRKIGCFIPGPLLALAYFFSRCFVIVYWHARLAYLAYLVSDLVLSAAFVFIGLALFGGLFEKQNNTAAPQSQTYGSPVGGPAYYAQPVSAAVVCPVCGCTDNEEGYAFCSACGAKLPVKSAPTTKTCPHCGFDQMALSDHFCKKCGNRVD